MHCQPNSGKSALTLIYYFRNLPFRYRIPVRITKKAVYFILSFCITNTAISQTTIISGRVSDAVTLEPVGFVDVYFKNTSTGSRTNFEGLYEINTTTPGDSLTVRFLGYKSLTKPIKKGETQIMDFQLEPSAQNLGELVIVPGENPAVTILKKVWKNKKLCNIEKSDAYQFESYSKTQAYLRKFINPNDKSDTTSDKVFNRFSVGTDEKTIPALPVYMNEALSDIYFIKSPQREKVVVKAANTNSLSEIETDMVTQLIQKSVNYNFNKNFVKILDKNFVSPISSGGLFYYKYYLTDSLVIDGKRCWEIRVKARRKEDLAFNGTIWINDTSFALKRISVETGKEAGINFVQRIKIQQDLEPVGNDAWAPVKTRILANAVNIFITAFTMNRNFVINEPKQLSFYDKEIEISDTAYEITPEGWNSVRPQALNITDIQTTRNIDSLKKRLGVKILSALVSASVKGYINPGLIELGPWIMIYRNNDVEGNRFRLGFRTSSAFSKQWIFKGFIAYGTKDLTFKYNAQAEKFISRKSWTKAGIRYSEDVENAGAVDEFYSGSSFISLASSFGGSDKLNRIKLGRVWLESDIFKGFTQKIVLTNKLLSPVSSDYIFAYYNDDSKTQTRADINFSEITLTSVYQPKAAFIIDKNERFPVMLKKSPVITINYSYGFKGFLKSNLEYHKASAELKHNFMMGGLGNFMYDVTFSKVFTALPYPLLNIFAGNESFFRSDKMYNLMEYGEFVADQAAELFCSYHPEGFIFDKFPLIKKLGLRTVASAHIAFGSFDEKKNGTYDSICNQNGILPAYNEKGDKLTGFNTLNINKPYAEVSYGIENIFRIFRIDAIHRLTYLDYPGMNEQKKPGKFGFKISAAFKF